MDHPVDPGSLSFLEFFPAESRRQVLALFQEKDYAFGECIVREGEPADAFYLLKSGRARVVKTGDEGSEIPLNVLRPGDSFGEASLYEEGVRSATVRCSTDVTALRLLRSDFVELLSRNPEVERYCSFIVRHRALHNFIREFSGLRNLPLPAIRAMTSMLTPRNFRKGEVLIRQGGEAGPMYILQEGRAKVYQEVETGRRVVAYLREGDFFGEMSLFQGAPRSASVEGVTDGIALELNEESFRRLSADFPEFRQVIEERISRYRSDREAALPADFAHEMLPAEASAANKLDIDSAPHVDERTETEKEGEPADDDRPAQEGAREREGLFARLRRRVKSFPIVRQADAMDCGAACIAMICRFYGKRVSLAHIRKLAHVAYDGTSLGAICRAATELGLSARAAKVSRGQAKDLSLPAIIHWDKNHWVVLFEVGEGYVRIADPGRGLCRVPVDEFNRKWSGYAAFFDYTDAFEKAPEARPSLSWIVPLLRPYRWIFAQVVLLAVVVSSIQLVLPIFTQVIVDKVIVEENVGLLKIIVAGMVVALAFMLTAGMIQRYLLSFVAVRVDSAILDFLTRRMLALPMSYFNTRRTGDIQRRLQGAQQLREFVIHSGIGGCLAVFQVFAYLSVMAAYSVTLFLVFMITIPLYCGLMFFSSRVLRPLFDRMEEGSGKYSSHQIDAIKGIEAVKAAAAEQSFRDTMLNEFISLAGQRFRSNYVIMFYESAVSAVGFLSTVLFLLAGASMVVKGQITLGAFVAFNALVAMAYAPISTVLGMWDDLQLASVLLNRLNDIFECEPEQGHDRSRLRSVPTLEGHVEIRAAGFQYGGPESPHILKNVSLEVPPGKTVAVVGRSGSGKTTLIKCLAGLLEVTEGAILFDHVDMKTLNYRDLRRKIGMVLQENYIFDETIMGNIAFGDPEPDMDRVIWAARTAHAHDFVSRLPLGYETRIGEKGLSLSGGQNQRVAIARALYSNPPVLIFDEATSALDTESERAIQNNLAQLLSGRTTFVIAHRLSTIRNADHIIVLEKGEIVEQGSHDSLMDRKGLYFYLNSQQLGI